MTESGDPIVESHPKQRVLGTDPPDWPGTDEAPESASTATENGDDWVTEAVTNATTTGEKTQDSASHSEQHTAQLQVPICCLVCQDCETKTLRRHHDGCSSPILRIGADWRCGGCGVDIQPATQCHDCGGKAVKRAATVPLDLQLEARPVEIETAIHQQVNHQRTTHGLDPLAYSHHLSTIAQRHSRDMADRSFVAHTNPDGAAVADRYRQFEHDAQSTGENIARVYPNRTASPETAARAVVEGWMASPGHRENILRERFQREGIGVFLAQDGAVLATQNFY